MYKLYIFCPDKPQLIKRVINAAAAAGAGVMGNYTRCATVITCVSQWKTEKGAHPAIGKVGTLSRVSEVKIEMICPENKARAVYEVIRHVHPYEEPAIEFIKMEKI